MLYPTPSYRNRFPFSSAETVDGPRIRKGEPS